MKASSVLCVMLVAGLLAASAQAAKDCPAKAGYTTLSNINWDNTGGLQEGQLKSAAAAEAFCNQNKHCYALNDYGYYLLTPPVSFAGFYPYEDLCTYMVVGKHY